MSGRASWDATTRLFTSGQRGGVEKGGRQATPRRGVLAG